MAGLVLQCPNDHKNRVVSAQATPTVKRSRLGRSSPRGCFSPALVAATFFGSSFSFSFPTSSASTSFVSRRIGSRGFARFVVGSLFFPELLCLFKVDLLIHCDCTVECGSSNDHYLDGERMKMSGRFVKGLWRY